MVELARYREGPATVVVSRDGDELLFWSSYDDYGRTITEASRIDVANFVAKGEGPWHPRPPRRAAAAGAGDGSRPGHRVHRDE